MLRVASLAVVIVLAATSVVVGETEGAAFSPLRVVLIPADGGTEDGTRADFEPTFAAVSSWTGLQFEIRVGQSYNAVVEAMCNGAADVAFFGPASYIQAQRRGCAELLAVAVEGGESVYYAGVFAAADTPISSLDDLKGKRVAFGDINSTSSFLVPMAMFLHAGIDPIKDLASVRLTGSHANSLGALVQGQVDAASLSFDSFQKAMDQGFVDPRAFKVVARSSPIPNPPIGMNTDLPEDIKAHLREGFARLAEAPGIAPGMIRGYGGKVVDGYDSSVTDDLFLVAVAMMEAVDENLKVAILEKAVLR